MHSLNLPLIEQAASFLKGKIRRTPVEYSPQLSEVLKVPVYLKLEFLQLTGSFKLRGGLFYLSTLTAEEKRNGVAACSAGNHGLGVAYAAQQLGVECTIFVPKNVEQVKYDKIAKTGAIVKKSEFNGYDDTCEWAEQEAASRRLHMISAFDDERIMASNGGSLAMEVLEDLPDAKNFIVPVGGGGLCAGIAYYAKAKNKNARIIGSQHIGSPALKLSLERGEAVTRVPGVETVAAAIEGGLGVKCFEVLKTRVSDVALQTEEEIIHGFNWLLKNHQYLIEPSSAVAIASCLSHKIHNLSGPTVVILSGRNISFQTLQRLIAAEK